MNFDIITSQPNHTVVDNGFNRTIQLCFSHGNHYDTVYPVRRFDAEKACQGPSALAAARYAQFAQTDKHNAHIHMHNTTTHASPRMPLTYTIVPQAWCTRCWTRCWA